MHRDLRDQIENLEDSIFVCFGQQAGHDLPVASDDDVILDLLHDCTGKSMNLVDAEFRHQTNYF